MRISGKPWIAYQSFSNSLRNVGFKDEDISCLHDWLTEESNWRRISNLKVHAFSAILKKHGVRAFFVQSKAASWKGYLDIEQEYFDKGESFLNQEQYDAAISAYQKAIKINSKSAKYYQALGDAYDAQKGYEKAIGV